MSDLRTFECKECNEAQVDRAGEQVAVVTDCDVCNDRTSFVAQD